MNCRQCGAEFSGHFNTRFCSDECRRVFKQGYIKTWKAEHKPPPKPVKPNPIEPFPAEIDREGFGHWLSGFMDGEASFGLRIARHGDRNKLFCWAHLRVTLRDDDAEALRLIQSFWGCGRLYWSDNSRCATPNANPVAIYNVQAVAEHVGIVLPHFDRYPLRAKKKNDLAIWRQGVELMAEVQSRPTVARLGRGGVEPRWTDAERERFRSLSEHLSEQRRYAGANGSSDH